MRNLKFDRVDRLDLSIIGGDIRGGRGNGGESIYGETFHDEAFIVEHNQRGILG